MSDTPAVRLAPVPDAAPAAPIEGQHRTATAGRKARAAAVLTEPMLIPAQEAARLVGIGRATWFRLKSVGKTPAPLKLAGRVLYRVEDLRLWVSLGCPPRQEFEARKAAANANGRPR